MSTAVVSPAAAPAPVAVRRGRVWLNWRLVTGVVVIVAIFSLGIAGRIFVSQDKALIGANDVNVVPRFFQKADPALGFRPNEPGHLLGTDSQGRDMLAVIVVGAPRTLYVGVLGAALGVLVGVVLGFLAGFRRGVTDTVITTGTDVALTIPGLAVLVVLASVFSGLSLTLLALVMALFAWPIPTRVIRGQVLSMRDLGYVRMAVLSGFSAPRIMFREVLPNLMPYVAATFTSTMAGIILAVTGLETLGLAQTRLPTLGSTVNNALQQTAVFRGMWWWWGPPVVVLVIIFMAFFLILLGLDEVANPRLRKAGA